VTSFISQTGRTQKLPSILLSASESDQRVFDYLYIRASSILQSSRFYYIPTSIFHNKVNINNLHATKVNKKKKDQKAKGNAESYTSPLASTTSSSSSSAPSSVICRTFVLSSLSPTPESPISQFAARTNRRNTVLSFNNKLARIEHRQENVKDLHATLPREVKENAGRVVEVEQIHIEGEEELWSQQANKYKYHHEAKAQRAFRYMYIQDDDVRDGKNTSLE
jgi:hypothetical protein